MTWSTSRSLIPLLVVVLVTSSGCISPQGTVNATSIPMGTTGIPAINASSPVPTIVAPLTKAYDPASTPAGRSSLNVVRGEPFTINGTVDNLSITDVQVWLLDGTISTTIIPVMPDGSFRITLDSLTTAALSRYFSSAIVVQYPSPPDHFSVMRNTTSGEVVETESGRATSVLAHLNDDGTYPTTQADYLEQVITAAGDSDTVYFLNGVDAWITIDPVSPSQPGTLAVRGNTSLPAGTELSIRVATINAHPTPQNYDFSHEITDGTAVVSSGTGGASQYSGIIDTSRLNTGKYTILVASGDDNLQANTISTVDLIAPLPAHPEKGNYINWSRLALPDLVVNGTLQPVMLDGGWRIVPPGTQKSNNEVPYGSIIDCTPDGICRIFNQSGIQFFAVYDSNEAHSMEVPNGAMVDTERVGNVTFIELNGEVILTKIDEYPRGG